MLKQWCSTCSPTVRLVGIYCQLNLFQEPHPGNRRVREMNETHCHGEQAGEEPLQLPPITIHNPSNSSAEGNKHKIFLAKAIEPCPGGKESRRWICPPTACRGQAGAGAEREQGRNSTQPAPLCRKASTLFSQPFGIFQPISQTGKAGHHTGEKFLNM